jgi:hypothetical protein
MRDDLQYVLAVYAKLHLGQQPLGQQPLGQQPWQWQPLKEYPIPSSIAAFNLQRWQQQTPSLANSNLDERSIILHRLIHNPLLIAFGLSLKNQANLTDLFFACANYIKTQLSKEEEAIYFNNITSDDDIAVCVDTYEENLAEQQLKQQVWLQQQKEHCPGIRLPELLPCLGSVWLKEVFPLFEEGGGGKIMALGHYKMFDIY